MSLQLSPQQFPEELDSAGPAAGDAGPPEVQQSNKRLLRVFNRYNRQKAFLACS